MPFLEHGAEPILRETLGSTLHVVDGLDAAADSSCVVITIGTPIDEYLSPRYQPLFDSASELAPYLTSGHHVVLRSTVFPGTTRELGRHFASLDVGVHLSYCPERIAQGYAITELDRLPQIVSGLTDEAVDGALELFGRLTDRLLTVTVEEAELAKLFLNSWRYIQFAIANQFYMIAEEPGLDFFRIHRAMTDGYDRASRLPATGLHRRPLPAQGHDAALGFRALATSTSGMRRWSSTKVSPNSSSSSCAEHHDLRRRRRDPRDGVQARTSTTRATPSRSSSASS